MKKIAMFFISVILMVTFCSLDFAEGKPVPEIPLIVEEPYIGLRIHARKKGVLLKIGTEKLLQDPRVISVNIQRQAGSFIKMPPDDYDSWVLGHIIFKPDPEADPEKQCNEMINKLVVNIRD